MPINNERFIFAPGNQWIKEKDAGPYFGLPAAWRRFIFQILTNREFAVYSYVSSVMDPIAIAYPTPEQIAEDMGIRTRSVIVDALKTLVDLGFLLAGPEPRPGRMGKRTIYQRPLPHHTLYTLLELGKIDFDLFPTSNRERVGELTKASDDVVRASLKKLLGDDVYLGYASLRDPERRKRILKTALAAHVKSIVDIKTREIEAKRVEAGIANFVGELPEWMRTIIAEEHPDSPAAVKTPF